MCAHMCHPAMHHESSTARITMTVSVLLTLCAVPAVLSSVITQCASYSFVPLGGQDQEGKAGSESVLKRYTPDNLRDFKFLDDSSPYVWHTSLADRQAGLAVVGSPTRLRAALHRLSACPNSVITTSFIGGSATHGVGAEAGLSYPRWVEVLMRMHLIPADQQQRLKFFDVNGPLDDEGSKKPKQGSADICHHLLIPETSDIVFVDHAVAQSMMSTCDKATDFESKTYGLRHTVDHLIRSLLELPSKPAIILVNSFKWAGLMTRPQAPELGGFWTGNCERDMFEFATYYQLPSMSLKAAVYQRMVAGEAGYKPFPPLLHPTSTQPATGSHETDKYNLFYTDKDGNLNGATGARVLGELAVQVVLDAAASLKSAPFNPRIEQPRLDAPLPKVFLRSAVARGPTPSEWCAKQAVASPANVAVTQVPRQSNVTLQCDATGSTLPHLDTQASGVTCHDFVSQQPAWESIASHGNNLSMSPHFNEKVEFYDGEVMRNNLEDVIKTNSHKALGQEPYEWFTPDDDRMAGLVYRGNKARLRNAADKLVNRNRGKMTVTFVGASITAGAGMSEGLSYTEWVNVVLRKSFPNVPADALAVKTVGLHATTSALMASCHNVYLPQETDIFFLEYAVNDAQVAGSYSASDVNIPLRRATERLVRKLLNYPNKPAVIFLNSFKWKSVDSPDPIMVKISTAAAKSAIQYTNSHITEAAATKHHTFLTEQSADTSANSLWMNWTEFGGYAEGSAERGYMELAWYYGLPSVSVKAAVFNLMQNGVDGFGIYRPRKLPDESEGPSPYPMKAHLFYYDWIHPDGWTGARVMGELASQIILDAAASIKAQTLSPDDSDGIHPIPTQPMIPNNYESKSDTCMVEEALKDAAQADSKGFVWTDEGRGKWGWVATEVGSTLLLHLEAASSSGQQEETETEVGVSIGYLKSFEHMGMALVKCASGCVCNATVLDGNTTEPTSQLRLQSIKVTKSAKCILSLTVLEETNCVSKEHKFKVGGVMISEDQEGPAGNDFGVCIPGGHMCLKSSITGG